MKPSMWLISALSLAGCGHSLKEELPSAPRSLSPITKNVSPPIKRKVAPPISEITIQRTPGSGMNPPPFKFYSLTLRSDGTATCSGFYFTDRELKGTYRTTISREEFDRLAQFVAASHFIKFRSWYGPPITERASVSVSVVWKSKRKVVEDVECSYPESERTAPKSLKQIQQWIDALAADARWEKVSDKLQFLDY